MSQQYIGVFVAWPYANGDLHLGHLAGAYLPADIFTRYHRLRGNQVLMVSGSDTHGTPITIRAQEEGISPRELYETYHHHFLESWQTLGISFDLFTHTDTENHAAVAQDIFRTAYEKEDISLDTMLQLYDEEAGIFLPDRYVEGECPHCHFPRARGDQCDNCGRTLDAIELVNPRSKVSGSTPVIRETEHFFFDLPAYTDELLRYVSSQTHWRPNVQNFVQNYLKEGLKPRPVSRDIDWGIPVPVAGYENKVMYVWFEAVIGYLSASIEWAKNQGEPTVWESWWKKADGSARGFYFIGKDNIPFHAIIWPAELLSYGKGLLLPYDIPANEFLNLEGEKFSTSRNWAVWLPDYVQRYDPDPLRYYLTAIAPETRDADFTWEGFVTRNNSELIAAWGNLVNRIFNLAHKHWRGMVPEPGALGARDREIIAQVEAGFERVAELYETVQLRAALSEAMELTRAVNKYLDDKQPWREVKADKAVAAKTIYTALRVIDSLKLLFAPILPHSSSRLHHGLGYDEPLFGAIDIEHYVEEVREHDALTYHRLVDEVEGVDRWRPSQIEPGQQLRPLKPLFKKLDEAVIEDERARLG
ncbi:MAG TPA: methionine--tRNA ligase [Chloroflexi bacterium]|nr:methionine--tRNA ligase [Chloroflexota bacterium]